VRWRGVLGRESMLQEVVNTARGVGCAAMCGFHALEHWDAHTLDCLRNQPDASPVKPSWRSVLDRDDAALPTSAHMWRWRLWDMGNKDRGRSRQYKTRPRRAPGGGS
jgi:hypothetical protein